MRILPRTGAHAETEILCRAGGLKYGDAFEPGQFFSKRMIRGGLIPSEVRTCTNLSCGAKVLYSALIEWRARQQEVFPCIRWLAADIGLNQKETRKCVRELETYGLIRLERSIDESRPEPRQTNLYSFLYHPIFEDLPDSGSGSQSVATETPVVPTAPAPYSHEPSNALKISIGDAIGLIGLSSVLLTIIYWIIHYPAA